MKILNMMSMIRKISVALFLVLAISVVYWLLNSNTPNSNLATEKGFVETRQLTGGSAPFMPNFHEHTRTTSSKLLSRQHSSSHSGGIKAPISDYAKLQEIDNLIDAENIIERLNAGNLDHPTMNEFIKLLEARQELLTRIVDLELHETKKFLAGSR